MVDVEDDRGTVERYLAPFVVAGGSGPARPATPGDGAWRALAVAIGGARILGTDAGGALVCRPALALPAFAPGGAREIAGWAERSLGADQSNTSAVLGERLLLKAFRRLEKGLNPDLEMTAFLSEDRGLRLVPALAGSAEHVDRDGSVTTVAILQELVPDAEDAYESTADRLAAWIAAPGVVALEFATEDADELGSVLAELHASLADPSEVEGFAPRPADLDDLRRWRGQGEERLEQALVILGDDPIVGPDLRAWAEPIRRRLAILGATSPPPFLTRVHGDLHLGQILRTPDGFVLVDFEGEPMRLIEDRRRVASPLRDVAGLLLSFDHVSSDAERRAQARGWWPGSHAGLDIAAWRRRSRERLLGAYRAGLRRRGAPIAVDEGLLDGLAVAKECDEFVYAATYVPEWLYAPHAGMRRLLDGEPSASTGGAA
jgi:trehalose synthase-fused probable maltokinase